VDRIRLVNWIVGRHVNLQALKASGCMKRWFILHDEAALNKLVNEWVLNRKVNCFQRPTPLLEIRDYFGEKIGLYFAWLDFYTHALKWPAFVGILVFIVQSMFGRYSQIAMGVVAAFAIFISIW
jgi:hypothetical protein